MKHLFAKINNMFLDLKMIASWSKSAPLEQKLKI